MCQPDFPEPDAYDHNPQIPAHFTDTPELTPLISDHNFYQVDLAVRNKLDRLYQKHRIARCSHIGLFYAGTEIWLAYPDRDRTLVLVLEMMGIDIQEGKWRLIDTSVRDMMKSAYTPTSPLLRNATLGQDLEMDLEMDVYGGINSWQTRSQAASTAVGGEISVPARSSWTGRSFQDLSPGEVVHTLQRFGIPIEDRERQELGRGWAAAATALSEEARGESEEQGTAHPPRASFWQIMEDGARARRLERNRLADLQDVRGEGRGVMVAHEADRARSAGQGLSRLAGTQGRPGSTRDEHRARTRLGRLRLA
ncbi:hypothetical protein LTR78_001326 [Recurvomyces mirabilis]|uniref:Uncharacterized protein n=1 Tax=Recurvomyces mirabilis TaxID=574656 RepID=A0AAE0WVV7_9PEZI|nr:hypothetical protein LTR78_001326 [Recurvomyces mirabilis]KAK5161303.1 hypothetical protein LTS14_001099 [Recurvomyces mirabilis]